MSDDTKCFFRQIRQLTNVFNVLIAVKCGQCGVKSIVGFKLLHIFDKYTTKLLNEENIKQ